MMMNKQRHKKHLLICLLPILANCSSVVHQPKVYTGENLITPYSGFLAGWTVYIDNKDGYHSRMWQHPLKEFTDSYMVSVTRKTQYGPQHYRKIVDKPGTLSCDTFQSITLPIESSRNYPTQYWETSCKNKNGSKSKILHRMLQGNDSFYHIQKIWQNEYNELDINLWKERFEQVYICDTRDLLPSCPSINNE